MLTDEELQKAINATTAPRVEKEYIESRIEDTKFLMMKDHSRSDDTTTVCTIYLDNGFSVIGSSACVNPENFNKEIGEKIAYNDAFNKLRAFFGFLPAEAQYNTPK